jgi:hypothetical protein
MAGNTIFRGPTDRQPRTISKPVSGAYLPGTFVEDDGANLTQLTTAVGKRPLLLGALDFAGADVATAYTSGDTGVAFELDTNQHYQAAVAAATYAANAPLTVAASGRLAAASSGDRVVAHFNDTPGAFTAGQLADVVIADGYIAA